MSTPLSAISPVAYVFLRPVISSSAMVEFARGRSGQFYFFLTAMILRRGSKVASVAGTKAA